MAARGAKSTAAVVRAKRPARPAKPKAKPRRERTPEEEAAIKAWCAGVLAEVERIAPLMPAWVDRGDLHLVVSTLHRPLFGRNRILFLKRLPDGGFIF